MNPGQNKFLEATNMTDEVFPLSYLHANKEMFMLGMYLAPYGKNDDQVEYMHKKATTSETSIRAGDVEQKKE